MDLNAGNAITTKHALDFMGGPWDHPFSVDRETMAFVVGTCHGIYTVKKGELNLIAVTNDMLHNGHLDDVFEWFEFAAKIQGVDLYIRAFTNQRFKKHCLEKRRFKKCGDNDVVKKWKDIHIIK